MRGDRKADEHDEDGGEKSLGHARQHLADHDGEGADGGLHENLEGLEVEPVQIEGARDPAIGIVHGAHGDEAGDQEVEVGAAARLDAPAEAETEGHEINDGDDHGREEIAELEELPLEEKHLLEIDGIPFREPRHSSRSPVSLMKTSSRFDLLMVTPFSMWLPLPGPPPCSCTYAGSGGLPRLRTRPRTRPPAFSGPAGLSRAISLPFERTPTLSQRASASSM